MLTRLIALLGLTIFLLIAAPVYAAFPIIPHTPVKTPHNILCGVHTMVKSPRPVPRYDGDDRHAWPGAIAIGCALAGFILLANPAMLVPLAAGGLAIIFGIVGTDKEKYKHRGMAIAGIIAGAIVIAALLL